MILVPELPPFQYPRCYQQKLEQLAEGHFLKFYFPLMEMLKIDLNECVVLCALADWHAYLVKKYHWEKKPGRPFFCTRETIERKTGLKKDAQWSAIKKLVGRGFISHERKKGGRGRRYFTIDMDKIEKRAKNNMPSLAESVVGNPDVGKPTHVGNPDMAQATQVGNPDMAPNPRRESRLPTSENPTCNKEKNEKNQTEKKIEDQLFKKKIGSKEPDACGVHMLTHSLENEDSGHFREVKNIDDTMPAKPSRRLPDDSPGSGSEEGVPADLPNDGFLSDTGANPGASADASDNVPSLRQLQELLARMRSESAAEQAKNVA